MIITSTATAITTTAATGTAAYEKLMLPKQTRWYRVSKHDAKQWDTAATTPKTATTTSSNTNNKT